jgi:hypothetical protein
MMIAIGVALGLIAVGVVLWVWVMYMECTRGER